MSRAKAAASLCLLASLSGAAPLFSQDPVPESEPNDTPATADTAVLGARVSGHSDTSEDVDYWVLRVNRGDTIYLDVDANEFHSSIVPSVVLFATDGATPLVSRGSWEGWDGNDPYLVYVAPSSGTYYVSIAGLLEAGHGPNAFYTINFRRTQCPVIADEREPNDGLATARTLSLGSSVTAVSCPLGDRDFYRIDVDRPMKVAVEMRTPEQWRPVFGEAVEMDARFDVLGDSGMVASGKMVMLAKDSMRVEFDAPTAGTYHVRAWTYLGGVRFSYRLSAEEGARAGPGDPVATVADSLGFPYGIAVSRTGDLYVAERVGARIVKISSTGAVATFAQGLHAADLAFDGRGDLLAIGGQGCCRTGDGALYRITPDGRYTVLVQDLAAPQGLAADPDGSIWVGEWFPQSLRHYDATGRLITSYDVSPLLAWGPKELVFGPSGDLYLATDDAIYRFKNGQFVPVLQERAISGFAFDAAGRIYVALGSYQFNGFGPDARIDRYDRNGMILDSPFARAPGGPQNIAFGRDQDGSPNRRLFFTSEVDVGEVRAGSIEVPGDPGPIAHARAMRELLRPGSTLQPWERDALDASGNHNGRYDIGDLRTLLARAGRVQ